VGATPPQSSNNSSFQAYGFGAQQRATVASNMPRRGSHVNVNITPTTSSTDSNTPEIRRYTKRLGSDILCGSLWGE